MTEPKEDVQAQIDCLRDKWHADRDRYRIGPSKVLPPRNYNVAKGVLWGLGYVAFPLWMLVFAGLIIKDFIEFDPSESSLVNTVGSWAIGISVAVAAAMALTAALAIATTMAMAATAS